jgi:Surface antigen variable number repeat
VRRILYGAVLLAMVTPVAARAQSAPRAPVALPAESAGWDRVLGSLLSAFDNADVVLLGEAHGRQVDAELRLRLIRHPQFPAKARFILIESNDLDVIDAVHDVNRTLSVDRQLRVLGGNDVDSPPQQRNDHAVALLREQVLQQREKALVIFGAGHVWHGEGGITKALQQIAPGRVFVSETLAPISNERNEPAHQALERALAALEDTLRSRERPVLVSIGRTPAGKLVANPFYLGQAMLPDATTLADLDDAIVYFGRGADAGALNGGMPILASVLPQEPGRVIRVEYEGSKRLDAEEIETRLRRHGITIQLDHPLDGPTMCAIREVLTDFMAEKGYASAEVRQSTTVVGGPGGARLLKVTFNVTEGQPSKVSIASRRARPSPAARCNR